MFIKIPFESEIDFKSNIKEITKMSLEHDYNINDGVVLGNFYISGEYKSHELSVNTEEFRYTLPFTVEIRNDINRESLEFNIEDFSYDIVDNNKLKVNIEYSLSGELEELEEREDDNLFTEVLDDEIESELAYMDDLVKEDDTPLMEEKEEIITNEVTNSEVTNKELTNDEVTKEIIEERINEEEEKTLMDNIQNEDDTYVTYHVHIVKESETFESISTQYKVPVALINEYNNMDTLNVGDKILIPLYDE